MEAILDSFICWIKERFGSKTVAIDGRQVTTSSNIELRKYFAITMYNYGDITAIINGTHPIPPNSSFTMSAYENHTFAAPLTLQFDEADSFGKNIVGGTTKGVSYITQQIQ